jgi:hypothetical protein
MVDCIVCRRPLATKASIVFKGDALIHAACWADPPKGRLVDLAAHRRPRRGVRHASEATRPAAA